MLRDMHSADFDSVGIIPNNQFSNSLPIKTVATLNERDH